MGSFPVTGDGGFVMPGLTLWFGPEDTAGGFVMLVFPQG